MRQEQPPLDLTDSQWQMVAPLLPCPPCRADGRGRPRRDDRQVLNAILWVLRTGAPWKGLPNQYPPYQTCHRRFLQWKRAGVMDAILHTLAQNP